MQAALGEPSASRQVAPLKGVGQVRSAEAEVGGGGRRARGEHGLVAQHQLAPAPVLEGQRAGRPLHLQVGRAAPDARRHCRPVQELLRARRAPCSPRQRGSPLARAVMCMSMTASCSSKSWHRVSSLKGPSLSAAGLFTHGSKRYAATATGTCILAMLGHWLTTTCRSLHMIAERTGPLPS